jgi:16S rRNA (guanine527-N7)-methyltransferase
MDNDSLLLRLLTGAQDMGLGLSDAEADVLLQHLSLVLEENQRTNLTRISDPVDAVFLHILDSLLMARSIDHTCTSVVDIGTGAGYPAIPIAVTTAFDVTAIDSVGKKIDALQRMVTTLGLGETVHPLHIRAEELSAQGNRFDAVVARAVAPIDVLLEYASPLLEHDGYLITSKGPSEELPSSKLEALCAYVGFENVSRETFELPEGYGTRVISVFQKKGEPRIKLPRRPGMATKKPLREKFS